MSSDKIEKADWTPVLSGRWLVLAYRWQRDSAVVIEAYQIVAIARDGGEGEPVLMDEAGRTFDLRTHPGYEVILGRKLVSANSERDSAVQQAKRDLHGEFHERRRASVR